MKKILIIILCFSLTLLYSQTPDWQVNSSDFLMHENLVAEINLNTIQVGNSDDMLAAFSGNEIRGLVSPNNISGSYIFFLVIHSNITNEIIEFKYWDSDAEEIRMVMESLIFTEGQILGSATSPFELNVYENFDFTPTLAGIPDQTIEVGESFNSINLENYTILEDADGVSYSFFDATNFEITITDNNLTISPNDLEWIGSEDVHIQITDVTSAGLYSTETVNFTVSEQSLPPIMSDVPGQTVFFDENFQTINLEEYLISQGNDEILWDYKLISEVNIENSPTWKIDPASFNFQMNIIARVLSRNSKIDSGNHLLGAFNNNNELRGVCSPLNVAGEYLFFLTVYSNNWNDTITFNFFDDSYNETLPILENKVFASNSVLGSSANPVELKAGRLVLDIDNQSNVTIHRVDSLWTGKEDLEFYAIENTSERLGDTTLTFVQVKNDLLPVELSNFSCEVYNENVVLNWRTETELNNYGFDVERETVISTERRNLEEPKGTSHSFSASWETLGFVQGHGNSNSRKIYSFLDSRPISGINRYRLKQIDTDGVFEYSEIVEVKTDIPTSFKLSQNFPNPFNPTTEINYSIPNNGINSSISSTNVALKIYDILGCEVATLVDKMQTPGNYSVTFNANQLSSGIYFYSIRTNVNVAIKKMILLR